MKYAAPLVSLALLLSACEPELQVVPSEKSPVVLEESSAYTKPQALDFGDVEHSLFLEVRIPESAIPESWTSEELRTASQKRLTMMTVDIAGPVPAELPIVVEVETKTDFSESPVALRGNVFRQVGDGDPEKVYSFKTLVNGRVSFRRGATPEPGRFPLSFSFDARQGLTEVSPTMLFYIETEAIMIEPGTNLDTVDPATLVGNVDRSGILLSNALRINLDPTAVLVDIAPTEAAPTAGDPAAAPASAEVAPADAAAPAETVAPAPSETPAPATDTPAPATEAPAAP